MTRHHGAVGFRRGWLPAVVALAALAISFVIDVPGASAYSGTWQKSDANSYAYTGLAERYLFGHGSWVDNNTWDSSEGADCSGYAAKVYALPDWSYPGYDTHPYDTYAFYTGSVPHTVIKSQDNNDPNNGYMTVFVYRHEFGGPGDHMGVFHDRLLNGTWNTWEAQSAATGIVATSRSIGTLMSYNYRRYTRDNWTG